MLFPVPPAAKKAGALLLLLLALAVPRPAPAAECFPAIDLAEPQYMIGYGSLMQRESRLRSAPGSSENLPIRLSGFSRSWSARGWPTGFSSTLVGVERDPGARIVASIYRVFDTEDVRVTDKREHSYCRELVEPGQIEMLDGSAPPSRGKIWIYVPQARFRQAPSPEYPINQSYVDIILSGCLQLEKKVVEPGLDFAEACIDTTGGWSTHWVNDRVFPRRPYRQPYAVEIDALLRRKLQTEFAAIRIE